MQAPQLGIIADVHDNLNPIGRDPLRQPPQELRGAGPTGKHGVVAHPFILRGSLGIRPEIRQLQCVVSLEF
jgi:hypothetical protein